MYARDQLPPYLRQVNFTTSYPYIHTLIDANKSHSAVNIDGNLFHNKELVEFIQKTYTAAELETLESALAQHGTTTLPLIKGKSVRLAGDERPLLVMPAIPRDSSVGDMSEMLYLRDQVQTAEVFLKLHAYDPARYRQEGVEGKLLLMSLLHLLSTPAQLERFQMCIERYVKGQGCTQADWPQISLTWNNLDGRQPNGWRNIQDTFQMLAYTTLIALEQQQLQPNDLLEPHKQFLGSIVPFLVSAGFPHYENSGSWEETAAPRTSVMAVETAFFSKLFDLRLDEQGRKYAFFAREYQKYRRRYPTLFKADFDELVATKLQEGLVAISQRLPFESPGYGRRSIKYRTSDLALVYVLRYHIPELLVRYGISVSAIGDPQAGHAREEQIEDSILRQLDMLRDPEGYGMYRYYNDSYQRTNWGTEEVQAVVRGIKRFVCERAIAEQTPVDYDLKQLLRNELIPKGRQAAWSLGSAQLAFWAAERWFELQRMGTGDRAKRYRHLATSQLNATLALVTGDGQFTSLPQANNRYHIAAVAPWRLPECYVTYEADNERCVAPSAHTPLNWATGLTKGALGIMYISASLL